MTKPTSINIIINRRILFRNFSEINPQILFRCCDKIKPDGGVFIWSISNWVGKEGNDSSERVCQAFGIRWRKQSGPEINNVLFGEAEEAKGSHKSAIFCNISLKRQN